MKKAVVIRHVAFETLGSFAAPLAEAGYEIVHVEAGCDDPVEAGAAEADLLVVLGGPIGVYQSGDYPFLLGEIEVVRQRLVRDAPTLGICLGCQIMAAALGAKVFPGAAGAEIGWGPITLTEAGGNSPLRELIDPEPVVLHWHGDTFDLPPQATLLASTARYPHQAFSVGRNGLALQFHPEVERVGLESWFIGHAAEIAHVPDLNVPDLRAETSRYAPGLRQRGQRMARRWLAGLAL